MNKELKSKIITSYSAYTADKFNLRNFFKLKIRSPEFRCVYHIISGRFYFQKRNKLKYMWHKFVFHRLKIKYGISVPIETDIDDGLVVVHGGGIIVNQGTKIGKNFRIRQNTTIGNDGVDNSHCPSIGDNVCVYANCVIFGKIEVGDNVVIGAGSVVTKSIPSNSMVVGNPARIIKRLNTNSGEWERIK